MTGNASSTPLIGDAFSESSTPPNAWLALKNACLTAGTTATPNTSIPACRSSAPQDSGGQGALELTRGATYQSGMVVATSPLSTASGLAITFTDYAFNGTTPGAQGLALFLSDASAAMPTAVGAPAGSLGYANGTASGLASAYVGVAFDEFGSFSSPTQGRKGGPGAIPETIAVRGAASSGYQYIGGALNAAGQPASLPFSFDQPAVATRPANAPTMLVTLTPAGLLSAAIDRHDGNGFVQYYSAAIVGVNGQPAVPASVYVGFTATTGTAWDTQQVGGFSVSALQAAPSGFTPTQIPNLVGWFDPSASGGVTLGGGAVSVWNDLSGAGNSVAQATVALRPGFTNAGINNLGSVVFPHKPYLIGSNLSFSSDLYNASSVFVVSNASTGVGTGSLLWSGSYLSNPRWNLRETNGTATGFDFNNNTTGRMSASDVSSGPALWSALGSAATLSQVLRKDGNTLSSGGGPGVAVSASYPLEIGALGLGPSATNQFTGQLGEILIYNRLLTTAESQEAEGYLACKWGLQNRLPANHPYRVVCPQGGTYPSLPLPAANANALTDPPQVRSQNGALVFNVVASSNAQSGNPQLTYNGSAVPPTLRLLPGDTLIVNLTNSLPAAPPGAGYLNDTNLHYHGLHVNPNAPGDDSIDMVAMPGQSLHYQIAIPSNHPTGLYWYHSHAHGEAERQNLAGMSGALIIDGIGATAPQVTNIAERILIVRDAPLTGQALPLAQTEQVEAMLWAMHHANGSPRQTGMRGMSMSSSVRGNTTAKTRNPYVVVDPHYRRAAVHPALDTHCISGSPEAPVKSWTLNGQSAPSIGIRPGEKQFWRLVNAGSDTYLNLQVDKTQMQVVALDGVPLSGPALTVSSYLVPPASRIEFVVTGPPAGTIAYLRTNCFDSGSSGLPMPAATLAALDPTSSPTDNLRRRERLAHRSAVHQTYGALSLRALVKRNGIARTQTLTYSDQDTINGQSYDPGGPPQFYAQSGTLEQWQIVNVSSQVHTFHIHQLHFLVQSIAGGTSVEQQNVGQELDNINVPAASANGPGSVTLVMDFTDPLIVGTFLLHCHILSHEDAGMMASIRVGTAPPMTTNAPAQGLAFASVSASPKSVTIVGGLAPYSVTGCTGVAGALVSGATATVTPTGVGGCVLLVADASGLSVGVAITVQAAVSPIVLTPNSLAFSTTQSPAQAATISGGLAPYTASGCQGVASSATSGPALEVFPLAAGACTLTVMDSAQNSQALPISVNAANGGSAADNDTFHQNAARQGWYQAETQLTAANVGSSNFALLGSLSAPAGLPAFGKVYGQPLYASNEYVAGTEHNLVIVSTSTDQVYAFDDVTGAVVWHASFTNPAAGITNQSWADTGCSDVNPNVGITGTPVIDRTADRLFVVVPTKENGVFHQRLHALSLQNGSDAVTPVEVSASVQLATGGVASTDPEWNYNRAALLEANGNIYVALGSHCDFNSAATHGWIMAYNAASLQPAGTAINVTNATNGTYSLGSIWMSGYGPAADAQGNIYFATGNGPWDGVSDFAMSVLKLPGTLALASATYFTPATAAQDATEDADLGSGGVMLLPDGISAAYPHLVVAAGKLGAAGAQKYLLNRDNLGGQQNGDAGAVWHLATTGIGIWGGPAYFQNAAGNSFIVYGDGEPLNTYLFNPASAQFTVASSVNVGCLECRDAGSQPVVSSNGTTPGTTVVWALKTPGQSGGTLTLFAFDASNMKTIYSGVAGPWTQAPGTYWIGGAFISPLVANGRVYVPTDGAVAIFGIRGTVP